MIDRYSTYAGQTLMMKHGGKMLPVKVLKVNPKNIKVKAEDGTRWNCSPVFLFEAPAGTTFTEGAAAPVVLGSVVRFKDAKRNKYPLMVVVGSHAGAWRLAKLGGDKGRYYRGIDAADLEIVDFNLEGV
jgi:hypothetical protein